MQKRPVFVRDATGLVRNLGFADSLISSLATINILGGYLFTVIGAPFFFPGSNVVLVLMLGAIPALAFVGMYSILSAAIPRSGGDYVWTGRILGPRWASVMAVLFLFSQIIAFIGLNAWATIYLALAPAFFALGLSTGNPALVSLATTVTQPTVGFALSLIIIIGYILVGVLGINVFKKVNRFSFIVYVVMMCLFIYALVSVSPAAFQAAVDSSLQSYGVTYASVVSAVSTNSQFTTFSLYNSIMAFPLMGFLTYSGFNFNTYAAGETKEVSKSIPRALVLAVFITMGFLFLQGELTYMTMGSDFVNGVSYLWNVGKLGTLPVEPGVTLFISLATNPWIGFLINLGWAVGNFLVALQCVVMFSRILFALGFDRVIPTKFASVSERFHSPVNAVLTIGILSIFADYLYWYGPGILTGYLDSAIAVDVAYMIPGIAAFLLPLIRKDLYERLVKPLPGWLGKSIAGWPLVSICGLCVTLIWAFGIYASVFPVTTYSYLGSSLDFAFGATIVPIIGALILFEASRAYHKKKGLDIMMAFMEIPPE
jgi:amino acid transporter